MELDKETNEDDENYKEPVPGDRQPVEPPGRPYDRETHTDPDGTIWIYISRYSSWFLIDNENT